MKTHMDLDVWKLSIEVVKNIYEITKSFPKEEVFGLTSQIKKAVISYIAPKKVGHVLKVELGVE